MAAFAANKIITDDKIVSNLSNALMTTIEKSVENMGIHIKIQQRFQQGPLVVVQFQVMDVALMRVIRVAKGEEFAQHFQALLGASAHLGLGDTIMTKIHEEIYGALNDGMIKKLSELLPE